MPKNNGQKGGDGGLDREPLEKLFFGLQRHRIALTCAIMELREESAARRPRGVLRIMVALLRLQRANRRAEAALGEDAAA